MQRCFHGSGTACDERRRAVPRREFRRVGRQRSGILRRKRGGAIAVKAQRLAIRGRVQGVGYRDAAVQAAFELGIHGWVRNRQDGSVEALAQGEAGAVDAFAAWCRRGPPLARVVEVALADAVVDASLRTFETRRTD